MELANISKEFHRGDIYFIKNDNKEKESKSQIQRISGRPLIIVSNNIGNKAASILEGVLLTTQKKKPLPTHVKINSARKPSIALCEQIITIDKKNIGKYIGQCTEEEIKKIDKALAVSIGLGLHMESDSLVSKIAVERDIYKKLYEELLAKCEISVV